MNKNTLAILLCVTALGFLPSCGGKKAATCATTEKTCQTRYSYDECDACYELDANAADVNCDTDADTDMEMINKF